MLVPWLAVRETCNWECHKAARNSDLGDDFAIAAGYPIPAPFNGTVRNVVRAEPRGFPSLYIVYITSDDDPSLQFEFMHLSSFVRTGHYETGQTIGYSGGVKGALGAGRSTGQHLHANAVYAGRLIPVRDALSEFSSVGTVTPVTDPALEAVMQIISVAATDQFDIIREDGFHVAISHAQAGAMFAGGAFGGTSKVVTAAERTAMLAVCDAFYTAGKTTGGPTDLTPVLTAIATLSTLETANEKAILAQLSALPDVTRKNIVAALAS